MDLLFPPPPPCSLCGEPLTPEDEISVCQPCLRRLPPIGKSRCRRCGRAGIFAQGRCHHCVTMPTPLAYSRSYGVYEGYLRDIIHALKYRADLGVAEALGDLMSWVVATDGRFGRLHVIVPVPLHVKRLEERGYNQALELATVIGSHLGIPVKDVCERIKETKRQSQLPFKERIANVRGAFRVSHPELIRGRCILLVDDVWTTGATLGAVSLALMRAGARRCFAICAAAGSLERDFYVGNLPTDG